MENSDAGLRIEQSEDAIFFELNRISLRIFEWQVGFVSQNKACRYLFLYGSDLINDKFLEKNGVSLKDFFVDCFHLYVIFSKFKLVHVDALSNLYVHRPTSRLSLDMIKSHFSKAVSEQRSIYNNKYGDAYQASVLRKWPIIQFSDGWMISPLPDLIFYRSSEGLYYDVVDFGQKFINDANFRFEVYVQNLVRAKHSNAIIVKQFSYDRKKGHSVEAPDVIVSIDGKVSMIIECKCAKMKIESMYDQGKFNEHNPQISQIIKGVIQLWRFQEDIKNGKISQLDLSGECIYILLTLDRWVEMVTQYQDRIISMAKKIVGSDVSKEILDKDNIKFSTIGKFEKLVCGLDMDSIISSCSGAGVDIPVYGRSLPDLNYNNMKRDVEVMYPFDIAEFLPNFPNPR